MKHFFYFMLFFLFIFSSLKLEAQTIEFGQDAKSVSNIIAYMADNADASYDVKYQDGEILDVILCKDNQYFNDLGITANFCRHYIMKNGKLAKMLIQYENVSISTLKRVYNSDHEEIQIDDYYFTKDFKQFSILYLAKNGYATLEIKKTDMSILPSKIRERVNSLKLLGQQSGDYLQQNNGRWQIHK